MGEANDTLTEKILHYERMIITDTVCAQMQGGEVFLVDRVDCHGLSSTFYPSMD